jgi:hypothetical protein
MKKLKLTKIIASTLITISVMMLNPIGANAWDGRYSVNQMTGSTKTVYADSYQWDNRNGSWICGDADLQQAYYNTWICTNGKWYYVNSNGWMVKNTWVNDYYVDDSGAWVPNAVKDISMTSGITNTANTNNRAATTSTGDTNTKADNSFETVIERTNNDLKSKFPCWVLFDGRYYYFNKDMALEYNTTIDGYELGSDGAWIENGSISKPSVIQTGGVLDSLMRDVIKKQSYAADVEEQKQEAKDRMYFSRQQQINELQTKLDRLKNGVINEKTTLYIKQYEKQLKELQDLNAK